MKIEQYIKTEFEKRLEHSSCLVIYDPEHRYSKIVHSLASKTTKVVDASNSMILAREEALGAWVHLSENPELRLVIYLPWEKPKTLLAKRNDPFAPFFLGGAVFPDKDADTYRELCLQAFPAQGQAIAKLFEAGVPSFAAVNSLAGGAVWPHLRALLGVESEREMILALLAPPAGIAAQLEQGGSWIEEARRLISTTLGLELHGSDWHAMQETLGRYILFSEFALDIPCSLPATLSEVPHAESDRRSLIYAICESLRDSHSTRARYRELAEKVDISLGLSEKFSETDDLGQRETFMFQNKSRLKACVSFAKSSNFDAAKKICDAEEQSIWFESSDAIRSLWTCVRAAVTLLEGIAAFESQVQDRTRVAGIVSLYIDSFSSLDAAYCDLEAFLADLEPDNNGGEVFQEFVDSARTAYFRAAESLHRSFIQAVEHESWINSARNDQAAVFRNKIVPLLEKREKTAFFMIDALRWDLAKELRQSLPAAYRVTIDMAYGRLPSITMVGMASLLPDADSKLSISIEEGTVVPRIGSVRVASVQERIAHLKSIYGDRVKAVSMSELEQVRKADIGDAVDLLVVRSTEIDAAGESLGKEALPMLSLLLRNLLRALERSRKLGFAKAVIVTDHGFLLLPAPKAGDAITKPEGAWEAAGPRYLLGEGIESTGVKLFDASLVGVPGYAKQFATPAGLGSFIFGARYVHGGLSLQECVLPVLTIDFPNQPPKKHEVGVSLSYKGGMTTKITTMRPSFDLSVSHTDPFKGEYEPEIAIAIAARAGGKEVGRAQASAGYDPGSGCFRLKPGKSIKITLAMSEEYRGSFTVSAFDPVTHELYAKLDLETDYTE
ncbi:MAG: PglZ domain protein [Spirochaetes bacterium ADurb.Bin110]|nr:MAG: PglZ domain protein [Spirochaetes bacterium ADurb.Bin110]